MVLRILKEKEWNNPLLVGSLLNRKTDNHNNFLTYDIHQFWFVVAHYSSKGHFR